MGEREGASELRVEIDGRMQGEDALVAPLPTTTFIDIDGRDSDLGARAGDL
jgi:hypothetical protein